MLRYSETDGVKVLETRIVSGSGFDPESRGRKKAWLNAQDRVSTKDDEMCDMVGVMMSKVQQRDRSPPPGRLLFQYHLSVFVYSRNGNQEIKDSSPGGKAKEKVIMLPIVECRYHWRGRRSSYLGATQHLL